MKWLMSVTIGVVAMLSLAPIVEWKLRANAAAETSRDARTRLHPFLQILPDSSYVNGLNEHRFRGKPIDVSKSPGTFRIFALGGSTTLGIRNTYSDTYPAKLQNKLREAYPDVNIEVQNAGVDWYSTIQVLVNYQLRVRDFHPDLIIVFVAINDLYRSFSPSWWASGSYQPDYSHYLGPFMRFAGPEFGYVEPPNPESTLTHFLLWREIRRIVMRDPSPYDISPDSVERLRARMREVDVSDFRGLDSFRKYYDLLIRTIRADGSRLLIASEPFLYDEHLGPREQRSLFFAPVFCAENGQYPNIPSMIRGMRQYNDVARQLAALHEVPFIDFEGLVPNTSEYFADDVHLTHAGNEILADQAFQWIHAQAIVDKVR